VLTTRNTTETGPFATAARLYRAAGWSGVFPVGRRAGEKWPPPGGVTGHGAPDPSGADLEAWIETHGDRNIGVRAPVGVIGLDVDAYEKDGKLKGGADALAKLEAEYGPLPPTWVSSARPAPSGIRWFRAPDTLDGQPINWPGEAAKGIEIIQHGHRYGVVWPSTNPEAGGARYEWSWSGDEYAGPDVGLPSVDYLTPLPEAWVRGLALTYARTDKTELAEGALAAWWDLLRTGAPCPRVADALDHATEHLRDGARGRHETARDAAATLARYGGEGHRGVPETLSVLGARFAEAVAGPGRDATGEWMRLLSGAVALAATDNPAPRPMCACTPPVLPVMMVPESVVVPAPLPDEPVEAETLTDAHLVQRLHEDMLDGHYVWASGLGWLAWTGTVWRECPDETVIEVVRVWAQRLVAEQVANPYIGAVREARQLLLGILSKYRLTAIVSLARGLCQVDAAAFDAQADLLNTPSGIVNLQTGEALAHDPLMRFTKITGVDYVPGAAHPDWDLALTAVRPDVAAWLQVRFGQAITGHMTPDDKLLLLRGGGENGKSTVLNAVKSSLGSYGVMVGTKVLLADPKAHTTEMTVLMGARFALAEELPDEGHLNVKRLKEVVGTPEMTARKIRENSVTWQATHSMFVSTNPLPKVTETDHGTWRRLCLVEFPYKYVSPEKATGAPHERPGDPGLRDRVTHGQRQREAVLAWLVEGARRWYEAGRMPPEPASVTEDTDRWRRDSDIVLRFWSECLVPDRTRYITVTDLHAEFNSWAEGQGHRAMSIQTFKAKFEQHDETAANGVIAQRRRVREGERRSYRLVPGLTPHGVGMVARGDADAAVGVQISAYWGVRFVHDTTAEQE